VRLEILWLKLQRAIEALERVVVTAKFPQRRTTVVVRLGIIRLDDNGLSVTFQRLTVASERRQRRAAIIVRLGELGFQLDRLVKALKGLPVALLGH
jgi:hypothetical protein